MKRAITQTDLLNDYNELKKAAFHFSGIGDLENSLKLIEGCSKLAYEFNFVEQFVDDDLENLLVKNSKSIISPDNSLVLNRNRVLFYDYFAINNRGLTQQYLAALMGLNYEILFVISNDLFYNLGNDIIAQLKNYSKSRIVIYSQTLSFADRITRLSKLIEDFKPAYAFLHLSPWDVIACSVFPLYPSIKRFFINLTDHAFWLGKSSFDVCLEFRNYGYQLSKNLRQISEDKLVILPYYPITPADESFKGLPVETKGKVIGLSGGAGYKFVGDNWKFYDLVSELLNKHENFIFILVGMAGNARVAYEKKVKQDKLQGRFIFLNDRYDIFQLIKHVDIYFGSYPFPGGLMTQMACLAKKPVLAYTNPKLLFSFVEDIISFRDPSFKAFDDSKEFMQVASKVIESEEYRKDFAKLTAEGIITTDLFAIALSKVMAGEKPYNQNFEPLKNIRDLSNSMSNWFLEIENTIAGNYFYLIQPYYHILKQKAFQSNFIYKYSRNVYGFNTRLKQAIRKMVPTFNT